MRAEWLGVGGYEVRLIGRGAFGVVLFLVNFDATLIRVIME